MFHLVYVSNATRRLLGGELRAILEASRDNNVQMEITGLLLYKDGSFMQLLEGREQAVRALLEKIRRDPRHYDLLTLLEGAAERRYFPDWSMGFRQLDATTMCDVPGYHDFVNAPFSAAEFGGDPSRCLQLLRLFRDHA